MNLYHRKLCLKEPLLYGQEKGTNELKRIGLLSVTCCGPRLSKGGCERKPSSWSDYDPGHPLPQVLSLLYAYLYLIQ